MLSVTYTFWQLYNVNKRDHINSLFMKNSIITQIYRLHLHRNTSDTIFEANLAVYNLIVENNATKKETVLSRAHMLKSEGFQAVNESFVFGKKQFYKRKFVRKMRVSMLEYKESIYFYLESMPDAVLIRDEKLQPYEGVNIVSAYVTIISIISILYILILQRLKPLRRLRKKIARFGEGSMDVRFALKGEDEIGMIGNELADAQRKINLLLESRTLFLRNIMHELKTPIAKGRILASMVKEQKQRERFEKIFLRLESLIGEFALIEEVSAGFGDIEKSEYRLIDLIDGAIDMAMTDYESVWVEIDATYRLHVNYRLYTTAIKNMIDNALKYSPNHQVKVSLEDEEIYFENAGERLKKPLSYYVEPFTKEHPAKDSFGLGLYLVDAILRAHEQLLAYEHIDGVNRFIFVPLKKLKRL